MDRPANDVSEEEPISRSRRARKIQVPGYGEMAFSVATVDILKKATDSASQLEGAEAAKEFISSIIIATSQEPALTREDVLSMSDEALEAIIDGVGLFLDMENWLEEDDLEKPYAQRVYGALWARHRCMLATGKEMSALSQSYLNSISDMNAELVLGVSKAVDISGNFASIIQGLGVTDKWAEQVVLPLKTWLDEMIELALPEPFLSTALVAAGINVPRIHTSTYRYLPPPEVEAIEDIEAAKNDFERQRFIDAYDVLLTLETKTRSFVESRLHSLHGDKWWKQRVPKEIREAAEDRKKEHDESPISAECRPIEFTYLDDLKVIVVKGDNWRDAFKECFDNKKHIETAFEHCARVRSSIAHSRPLTDIEYLLFTANARLIIQLIDVALAT